MSASPQWMMYMQWLLSLVFVIGLIFAAAAIVKKTGLDKRLTGNSGHTKRLSVVETLYLDPRRRLVIVNCDGKEHLLLLGASGDLLVESRKLEKRHEA